MSAVPTARPVKFLLHHHDDVVGATIDWARITSCVRIAEADRAATAFRLAGGSFALSRGAGVMAEVSFPRC
jgi:hypothetical protein